MKRLLLPVTLFFFCLGQLGRFEIPSSNITVHLNDLVIFTSVVGWLCLRRQKAFVSIKSDPLSRPILFVVSVMIISLLVNAIHFSLMELLTSSLYLFRWVFYAGLYFFLKAEFHEQRTLLRRGLVIAGVIISVTGLFQYLFIPNTTFLAAFDWDDHYYRLIGVFFDPGFTSAILAILLGVAFLNAKKTLDFTPVVLIYTALALTYSRASYLMYLTVFSALAYFRKSLKILLIAIIILTATIFVLPQHPGEGTKLSRDNSTFARLKNWQQSISIWSSAPLFGVGFNTYRYAQRDRGLITSDAALKSHAGAGADSSILLMLATTGILGFAAYMYLLGSIWKISRDDLLLKTVLPAVIIGSFFNNLLFYPWVMEIIWLLLASGNSKTLKEAS